MSMSALDRLLWLEHECQKGRKLCVAISFNHEKSVEKYKFVLDAGIVPGVLLTPGVSQALGCLRKSCQQAVVTDKGHCSKSSGKSIIEFYVRHLGTQDGSGISVMPPAIPPLRMDMNTTTQATVTQQQEHIAKQIGTIGSLVNHIESLNAVQVSLVGSIHALSHDSSVLKSLSSVNTQVVDAVDYSRADLRSLSTRLADFEQSYLSLAERLLARIDEAALQADSKIDACKTLLLRMNADEIEWERVGNATPLRSYMESEALSESGESERSSNFEPDSALDVNSDTDLHVNVTPRPLPGDEYVGKQIMLVLSGSFWYGVVERSYLAHAGFNALDLRANSGEKILIMRRSKHDLLNDVEVRINSMFNRLP